MKYANGSGVQWERKAQNNSKGLALNNSKEIVSVYGDGESYGREVSSGPGKLPMPLKSQEELSRQLAFRVRSSRGRPRPGWARSQGGWKCYADHVPVCAFLGLRPSSDSVILKVAGPQPGGLCLGRGWLLRERLRRVSGQTLVCLFPSLSTRKPHPVLQTDIQKSFLNCRLGRSAGARWLGAQHSVPRFRTPDPFATAIAASLRYQLPTFLPLLSGVRKTCGCKLSQEEKRLFWTHPPWCSTCQAHSCKILFFFFPIQQHLGDHLNHGS